MGSPKALLDVGGTPALARILEATASARCDASIVVTAAEHGQQQRIAGSHGADLAINPNPEAGMFSSVGIGLATASSGRPPWVLLWPVDYGLVSVVTVRALMAARVSDPAKGTLQPRFDGRPGHPLLLSPAAVTTVLRAAADSTLRQALSPLPRQFVDVDDPLVTCNPNTPAEWEAALELWRTREAGDGTVSA